MQKKFPPKIVRQFKHNLICQPLAKNANSAVAFMHFATSLCWGSKMGSTASAVNLHFFSGVHCTCTWSYTKLPPYSRGISKACPQLLPHLCAGMLPCSSKQAHLKYWGPTQKMCGCCLRTYCCMNCSHVAPTVSGSHPKNCVHYGYTAPAILVPLLKPRLLRHPPPPRPKGL